MSAKKYDNDIKMFLLQTAKEWLDEKPISASKLHEGKTLMRTFRKCPYDLMLLYALLMDEYIETDKKYSKYFNQGEIE